jgi:hypothetical protein
MLRRLAADRSYLLAPARSAGPRARSVRYPVRAAAAAGLARYGLDVPDGCGEFEGRALDQARRGGQDVTNDRSGLRHDIFSQIVVSPFDLDVLVPVESERR